ncbi:MAG: hypothetical protein AB8H12_18700 [Lewinella sp.]
MRIKFLAFFLFVPVLLWAQDVTTLVPQASSHSFEAISWGKDGRIYSPNFVNGHIHQINLDGTVNIIRSDLAERFQFQLSPNPVRDQLKITYELPTSASVRLGLHAPTGQLLVTMADTTQSSGPQELIYQFGEHLSAGQYHLVLTVNGRSATKPLVLIR